MKETGKTYTAEDLARYHSGTMPPIEMHELEKAALEDPFLGDALEGYANARDVKNDIEELNNRLTVAKKKKKTFFISSLAENRWWRMAAMFIIIAGGAYFFYLVKDSERDNALAKINTERKNVLDTPTENRDIAPPVSSGKISSVTDTFFESSQVAVSDQKRRNSVPAKPNFQSEHFNPAADEEPVASVQLQKREIEAYSDSTHSVEQISRYDKKVSNEYLLQGRVMDETGKGIPLANIRDEKNNTTTMADTAGRFSFWSPDSNVTATAAATGFDSKRFTLNKDYQPEIAMNRQAANLGEVVVTGYSNRKKSNEKKSAADILDGKAAGLKVSPENHRVLEDREKFDQYREASAVTVYNESGEPAGGEVLLSFDISKKGRPQNIKIIRSTCPSCEKEAIKLLKNGPGWPGKKNQQDSVTIRF